MPSVILATAGYDHTIRLWEARSGFCYRTLQYTDSQVNKLEITPNKKYLAAAGNPHIKLFELASNNPQAVSTFSGHKSNVTAIGFERQGEFLFSGSEDGTVKIWDPRVPNHQREFEYSDACNAVELHPNQTELVCGFQNGVMRVYNLRAGKCSHEFMPDDETAIRSISISNDGGLCCAATNRGKCFVWQLKPNEANSFELVHTWEAHSRYILKTVFSPDMSTVATASADMTVKVWDVSKNFELFRTLKGHQRWVWDCVYSSNSNYLVSGSSDHVARLWDLQQGETIRHYTGHHKAISCLALNDDEYGAGEGNVKSPGVSPQQPHKE